MHTIGKVVNKTKTHASVIHANGVFNGNAQVGVFEVFASQKILKTVRHQLKSLKESEVFKPVKGPAEFAQVCISQKRRSKAVVSHRNAETEALFVEAIEHMFYRETQNLGTQAICLLKQGPNEKPVVGNSSIGRFSIGGHG